MDSSVGDRLYGTYVKQTVLVSFAIRYTTKTFGNFANVIG